VDAVRADADEDQIAHDNAAVESCSAYWQDQPCIRCSVDSYCTALPDLKPLQRGTARMAYR